MSDKLKVVGAKSLDLKTTPRLLVSVPAEGSPHTIPDPSWDACGQDLIDVQEELFSGGCVNIPKPQDAEFEPVHVNLVSRHG